VPGKPAPCNKTKVSEYRNVDIIAENAEFVLLFLTASPPSRMGLVPTHVFIGRHVVLELQHFDILNFYKNVGSTEKIAVSRN
jgi:hypothetical protein